MHIFISFLLFTIIFSGCGNPGQPLHQKDPVRVEGNVLEGNQRIKDAFQRGQSHLWVEGEGEIIKILSDDNQGSRHQRFILSLGDQTLLIDHNIDVAPRLPDLKVGEKITFYGEYLWNEKGGMVHWTHHDPNYRQPGGWLLYQGQKYQ